jgi:hypothetical protein
MGQSVRNRILTPRMTHAIALGLAIVIGIILVIAAYGKIFHPIETLKIVDRSVAIFEILFLLAIFFFRNRWQMWLGAAVVFAAWCGAALFWFFLKLPCGCMGSMIHMPTVCSILLDCLFFFSSLVVGYLLGAMGRSIYFSILCALFASLVGFAFSEWVYKYFILLIR